MKTRSLLTRVSLIALAIGAMVMGSSLVVAAEGGPGPGPGGPGGPAGGPGGPGGKRLAALSPDERTKYETVRAKVLADNADLKAEDDKIMEERSTMKDATPEQKTAFREKMMSHEQKVREAMLKEDPSLGPIFDKLDKARGNKAGAGGGGNGGGGGGGSSESK